MNFFILVLFMILIEGNLYNGKLKDRLGSKAAGVVDRCPFLLLCSHQLGRLNQNSQCWGSGVWGSSGRVLCSAWSQGVGLQFSSECLPIIISSHSKQL